MTERYIGVLSGTSMDAVDAAVLEFTQRGPRLAAAHAYPFPDALREAIRETVRQPVPVARIGELDVRMGELFAQAVLALLDVSGLAAGEILAVGSHGQTLWHQPVGPHPFTLQIGDPNVIAETSGITTVADFRRRDMAAGGQGAPLVPAFHRDLFGSDGTYRVVLNLGGIANLTLLPDGQRAPTLGFDTGPGNILMDAWIGRHRQRAYDRDGTWAASAQAEPALLQALLNDPYFNASPPKSTGPEYFNLAWLDHVISSTGIRAPEEAVQATLAALTARSVADAVRRHARGTQELLVCGGGVHNRAVMEGLRHELSGVRVMSTQRLGIDPEWVEAAAFAWLARRSLGRRTGNLPSVTGAQHAVVLGGIYDGGSDLVGDG